jgi:FAD/FMN-containing dehydrogenase
VPGFTAESLTELVSKAGVDADQKVVTPANAEQAVEVVRALGDQRQPFRIGSSQGGARDPRMWTVLMHRINDVSVNIGSETLVAGAGATAEQVRDAASAKKRVVIGFGAGTSGSIGAILAKGDVPTRSVSSLHLVFPTGDEIRAHSALKDVAGYGITGAILGSRGRYGVIIAATFRLLPQGADVPAAQTGGEMAVDVGPSLREAFDPAGLLSQG